MKSDYVWFTDAFRNLERIKLEIGSSVRPHPYERKTLKSYIQEFLESIGETDAIDEYELKEVTVNVLNVERTFIDKVMSVKRHAFSGTLSSKARHIYDVVRLFQLPEIQQFLQNKEELKAIVRITKETDAHYLEKRKISDQFDPTAAYDFQSWKVHFSKDTRKSYELLHTSLLYSDTPQNWDEALAVFEQIGELLQEIGEYNTALKRPMGRYPIGLFSMNTKQDFSRKDSPKGKSTPAREHWLEDTACGWPNSGKAVVVGGDRFSGFSSPAEGLFTGVESRLKSYWNSNHFLMSRVYYL